MNELSFRLFDAIENHNMDEIKTLIALGVDVNVIDYDGCSPLYRTLSTQKIKFSIILLEAGADPTFKYKDDCHNCLKYILNYINGQYQYINSLARLINKWYVNYDNQKTLITNYPSIITTFIEENFLHEKLKEEYKHLLTANDLNLL